MYTTAIKYCPFCGSKIDAPISVTLHDGDVLLSVFVECVKPEKGLENKIPYSIQLNG